MTLSGKTFFLKPLEDVHAETFSDYINLGLNFSHTFTGSIPMRPVDVASEWERERKAGSLQWAIINAEGVFIGTTGLYSHRDIYRSWEFRILIGHPGAIGHGKGTEATRLVVDWGFRRLNAHRIWLGCNEENIGAVKCYEKVGFKREGVLRDDIFCNGKYVSAIRMSILENEWKSTVS